jgi:hypothetical protein
MNTNTSANVYDRRRKNDVSGMKTTLLARAVWIALALAGAGAVQAQDAGDASLDVTIRLLPENAVGPEAITRRIELPPVPPTPPRAERAEDRAQGPPDADLPEQAPPQSRPAERTDLAPSPRAAPDVGGEARERGRAVGQETAEQTP